MYAVVFFLLLWVLFQQVQCEINCTKDFLYILQTNDHQHIKHNEELIKILDSYRHNVEIPTTFVLENGPKNLSGTIKDTRHLRYVINLHVRDFYKYNHHKVLRYGFVWAGDIGFASKQSVCRSNEKVKKDGMETCTPSTEILKQVKLVSKPILHQEFLYKAIVHFKNRDKNIPPLSIPEPIEYKIIVCTKSTKDLSNYTRTLKFNYGVKIISYHQYNNCFHRLDENNKSEDIIAVIAHNPNWVPETNKPVIFYEEPYFFAENTDFYKNSIWRMMSWKPLTVALVQFLKKMNWYRVAILSDDAPESDAFEQQLRKLLERNGIAYTVTEARETDQQRYNFSQALMFLKKTDVKIIIANVVKQRGNLLANQANSYNMTFSQGIQWIARDWPDATTKSAVKSTYSILSVVPKRTPITMLIKGINRVIDHNRCNSHYNYLNHDKFAKDIREKLEWIDSTYIDITETKSNGVFKIASYKRGTVNYFNSLPYTSDRREKCNLVSINFDKPCDDIVVIYIMLVIAVTAITLLGITYFFQTPDTPYDRMIN